MPRLVETDTWSKAPVKSLLKHAKTVVDAEVANCTIFSNNNVNDTIITTSPNDCDVITTKTMNLTQNLDLNVSLTAGGALTSETGNDNSMRNVTTSTDTTREINSSTHISPPIPRFDVNEVKVGRVVGRGGFCVVSEIREIRLTTQQRRRPSKTDIRHQSPNLQSSDNNKGSSVTKFQFWKRMSNSESSIDISQNTTGTAVSESIGSSRSQLARQVWTQKSAGKVVMKQVNVELINTDRCIFLKGIIDIAMEAKFLASLNHPNIIKIRGECRQSPFDCTGYFIILDYLPETLPNRLNQWMHTYRATKGITGFCTSLGTGNESKVKRLMTERLLVAYDIATVGNYLHQKNIVFRDFKPDNIGFTSIGVTKLMDFGLARELTNVEKDENGLYFLTGLTGGIRYMAPEVGLQQTYNTKSDVYSWSMIFWYILSLEPPLAFYTPEMIVHRVFEKGHRPATKVTWSPAITDLLRRCWSESLLERPSFLGVTEELYTIVQSYDKNAATLMKNLTNGEGHVHRSIDGNKQASVISD
jgi:serine/threonine protein kinase